MPFSCSISSLLPSSSLQLVMVPHTCIMHIPALLAMGGNTLWCMMHTKRIEDLGAGLAAHFQLDGYPAFVACFLSLILASFSISKTCLCSRDLGDLGAHRRAGSKTAPSGAV